MSRLLGAVLFSTLILSCKKAPLVVRPAAAQCRVEQVVYSQCCGTTETLLFAYNQLGDPVSIKQLPGPRTGAPDYVFRYDKSNRLVEMTGFYGGGKGGEFYHRYFYANPGNSNITLDSVYFFPLFENNVLVNYHSAAAIYLGYDKWGRIIKDSAVYENGYSPMVNHYVYDANGNLAGRSYDNKVNIHQTNMVWMFLDRDYSINNPLIAAVYNRQGLPTNVSLADKSGALFKFIAFMRTADISYACRNDH